MTFQRQPEYLFWIFSLFWFFLFAWISPEFGGIDTYIFKDAGSNWAQGHGFVTSFVLGSKDSFPHLYACYPPGYPFLWGVFAKLFGVGAYQNTFFNLTIAWICSYLWYKTLKAYFKTLPASYCKWGIFLVLSILIPSAMLETGKDRPEALSLCFILLSLFLVQKPFSRRLFLFQSFMVGLNTLISPFGAILHLWVLLVFYRAKLLKLKLVLHLLLMVTIPIFITGVFFYVWDATFLERFLEHSAKNGSGLGAVFNMIRAGNYFEVLKNILFKPSLSALSGQLALFAILVCFPFLFLWKSIQEKSLSYFWNSLLILSLCLFPLIIFPNQSNYLIFGRTVAMAVVLWTLMKKPALKKKYAPVIGIVFFLLFLAKIPFLVRDVGIRISNRDSFQRAQAQADKLHALIKPTEKIAVWPSLYFLFKPQFEVIDLYWIPPQFEKIPSYLVLSYAESGDPTQPIFPKNVSRPPSPPLWAPKLPQPTEFFGLPISKSSNTWEGLVFKVN